MPDDEISAILTRLREFVRERDWEQFHNPKDLAIAVSIEANELLEHFLWKDADRVGVVITKEIPARVSADKAYMNAMRNSDKQNARIEHDRALGDVLVELVTDHTELWKQFSENDDFKKWLRDTVFGLTYEAKAAG